MNLRGREERTDAAWAAVVRGKEEMTSRSRRKAEAGYALLFVYMMAACVAIMLYMEVPRVAFEAQRDKEQILIDRGEQYERGIQLYFRKFHQYPATLDALDNTQNIRFIRRRYADPMTGKDEWRLIHVGPGGAFIDSLLNQGKSVAPATAPSDKSNLVAEIPLVDTGNPNDPNATVNLATRRRPSDGGQAAPLDPNAPPPPPPSDPSNPGSAITGVAVAPDQTAPGQAVVGQAIAGQTVPGQTAVNPLTQGIPAGQNPYAQTTMPGQPGAPPSSAVNLINQLLTSPRSGGLNGSAGAFAQPVDPNALQSAATTAGTAASSVGASTVSNTGTPITGTIGQTMSGGIAGVASKAEGEGIKLYNDRKKYKEWEFIYDLSKDLTRTGGGQTLPQQGQTQQNGVTTQSPFSSSPTQTNTTTTPATPPPPPAPSQQ